MVEVIDQATKIPAGAAVSPRMVALRAGANCCRVEETVMWFYNRDFEDIETLTCLETGVQVVRSMKKDCGGADQHMMRKTIKSVCS